MNRFSSLESEPTSEVVRGELLHRIDGLQHDWEVLHDEWMTADTYQDGTHADMAHNKLRNTWFTLVFNAVSSVERSGLLTDQAQEQLRQTREEVYALWKQTQAEGFEQFCEVVTPRVQANLQEAGISISDEQARLVGVYLAKDPSGQMASQTILGVAESLPFETTEVEINERYGITQLQSPDLAAHLASFAATQGIEDARELLGNSESVVRAADSLLDLARVSMDQGMKPDDTSMSYS